MTSKSNRPVISSPARSSSSSEDIFRDGLIDLQQLNYILRNPELPKSRLKINSILKQYNEQKCRAISLSRINYKSRHQINIANHSASNTAPSNHDPIDFHQIAEYEVKLSQLPQELLVCILGETFAKYEIEMNKRNELNVNQDIPLNRNESNFDVNRVCVKQEILPDVESDCEPSASDLNMNIKINELKQQLKKLIDDYESVEEEENTLSNNLQVVTKELENQLSALRECIALCETLKEQNLTISEKQNELKAKKSELKHEINKVKDKLIRLNDSYRDSVETSTAVDNEFVSEPVVRVDSTPNQVDNRQINISNVTTSTKTNNSSEINQKKRKVVSKSITTNSSEQNRSKTDIQIDYLNKNNSVVNSDSVEGTNSKLRKLSIAINSTMTQDLNSGSSKTSAITCETNQQKSMETDSDDVMLIDESDSTSENSFQSDSVQNNAPKTSGWRSNYVNLVFNPASIQSSSFNPSFIPMAETSIQTSSPKTVPTNPSPPISPKPLPSAPTKPLPAVPTKPLSSASTKSLPSVQSKPKPSTSTKPLPLAPSLANVNNRERINTCGFNDPEYLFDVTHHIKSVSLSFVPHVTCLCTFKDELFVGLVCGSVNKYLIEGNGFKFVHQYPNLAKSIEALYYSERYNYLYCGTKYGLFAYFNSNSKECDYDRLTLQSSITCFESSPTILFIGLFNGFIHRFGLMSNKLVNNFKCFNKPIIGLKLVNDLAEQNRIIVCSKNEISVRNSVDGSLLHTLESENSEFVGLDLYFKNIVIYTNVKNGKFHRCYVYDENIHNIINNFHHKSLVKLMTMDESCFYVYTIDRKLYCFDCQTLTFRWSNFIKASTHPISIAVSKKRVILGMPHGKIMLISPEENGPFICQCDNCNSRFPRMRDIFNHFKFDHALPFVKIRANYNNFFYCPWIGCKMRIKKNLGMIVEHLKSHVN